MGKPRPVFMIQNMSGLYYPQSIKMRDLGFLRR